LDAVIGLSKPSGFTALHDEKQKKQTQKSPQGITKEALDTKQGQFL